MAFHLVITGLVLIFTSLHSNATVIATGNDTSGGNTFTNKISAKVFDRARGILYVGLMFTAPDSSNKPYAVSYFNRANSTTTPAAQPFNASFNASVSHPQEFGKVAYLSLVGQEGDPKASIAVVPTGTITLPNIDGKRVHLITAHKQFVPMEEDLVDANSNTSEGVVALASNEDSAFAAIRPNGGNFGAQFGGIALVTQNNLNSPIEQQSTMVQLNTKPIDTTTPEIAITTSPTFTTGTALNKVALHWSHRLQRLYIGLDLTSGAGVGDGVRSVIVARLNNDNDNLTFKEIAPSIAFVAAANIVGAVGSSVQVRIQNLRTMHTSTGPHYLIAHGGVGASAPGNTIFALPLVYLDNANNEMQGVLANKNTFNVTTKQFDTAAAVNADLPTATDLFAQVGRGPLPIETTNTISDIVVIGDAVYASLDIKQDTDNETGIWYSQALFDQEGKIYSWTPWSKRVFPYNGFPGQATADRGRVALFDVDAINGKLWAVSGGDGGNYTRTIVATTVWGSGKNINSITTTPTSLTSLLNLKLLGGSFCALDIDRATPDLVLQNLATGRYALFGGIGKVIFARVSSQVTGEIRQEIIDDFTQAENFLVSPLQPSDCCVTSLGYSNQETSSSNYFFAGTQKGLFVFTQHTNKGFSTVTLSSLNLTPFTTGSWKKAPAISGSIVDMKTSDTTYNGNLYVLTKQSDKTVGFKCRLYSIPYTDDLSTMFAASNIRLLAESGIVVAGSDLSSATLFFGIEIVYSAETMREQLVLATNAGIFTSAASEAGALRGILDATTQAEAQWKQEKRGLYTGIFGPKAHEKSTTWPVEQTLNNCNALTRGTIRQCSGISSGAITTSFSFCPFNFTLEDTDIFDSLDPINNFWSDGGRRLFMITRNFEPSTSRLMCLPFNNLEWQVKAPQNSYVLSDAAFKKIKQVYWAQHIGATGILMAGTDRGVLSLE